MLFNTAKCTTLSPSYVNTASGLALHRFQWLKNDDLIGEVPPRWNHLVDYDPEQPASDISNLHFTNGGPYFDAYQSCGYANLWFEERDRMLFAGTNRDGSS